MGDAPPASSATPSASGSGGAVALGKPELRELGRNMVTAAGEAAHLRFAQPGAEKDNGLYTVRPDEAKGIGEPLADVVYRRIDPNGGLSPDAIALIRAGVVLATYVLRTATLKLSIWRANRSLRVPDLRERPDAQEATP